MAEQLYQVAFGVPNKVATECMLCCAISKMLKNLHANMLTMTMLTS